jgi:hypothetical protein
LCFLRLLVSGHNLSRVDFLIAGRAYISRHCERQRSNPWRSESKMDCFVAFAPRNDGQPQ